MKARGEIWVIIGREAHWVYPGGDTLPVLSAHVDGHLLQLMIVTIQLILALEDGFHLPETYSGGCIVNKIMVLLGQHHFEAQET